MAWTQEQLADLEASIAQGARRIKEGDKESEQRSLKEMLQLRDQMRRELGMSPAQWPRISTSSYRKGT